MNLIIRPLIENDAYTSVKWRNDKEVFKYTGNTYNNIITIESELEWIRRVIKNTDEYRCAILVNDEYIGNIYLTDINKESAFYHIFIGEKSFWGKGCAYMASKLILDYAFNKLVLRKVYLNVRLENINAVKLYRKLGFRIIDQQDGSHLMCLDNAEYVKYGSSN